MIKNTFLKELFQNSFLTYMILVSPHCKKLLNEEQQ